MKYNHQPKNIHKTLIWGGWYGSRNIGDSAILLGIKELYKIINVNKNYELSAISIYPNFTNTHGVSSVDAIRKYDFLNLFKIIKLINKFRKTDRVIVSGGTPIFNHGHLIRFFYLILSYIFKKEVIFLGIGVKKLNKGIGTMYLNFFLKKAKYISVRDQGSLKNLQNITNVPNIKLRSDSAFFVPKQQDFQAEYLFEKYNISEAKKNLIVAPRLMSKLSKTLYLEEKMNDIEISIAIDKISQIIDNVSSSFDNIYIFSMHYYGIDSDRPLIKEILAKSKKIHNLYHIDEELTVNQALNLLSAGDVTFAMRLHALLLSLSMNTPIVGLSYEDKVKELASRFNLENCVFPLFDFDVKTVSNKILDVQKQKINLSDMIKERKRELNHMALQDSESILKIK